MELSLFDYHLPNELIAQFPVRRRDRSRLLVLDRKSGAVKHAGFGSLDDYLTEGDALVLNNTRVFKARLLGKRVSGGSVEVFLIRRLDGWAEEVWEAMARPSRKLKEGERVLFEDGQAVELTDDLHNGRWRVLFRSKASRQKIIARHGHVPLPQYIDRGDEPSDIRRYQTVYASPDKTGAVAAPTAGFHFTKPRLHRLDAKGVEVLELTLHVGPGTFKPIQTSNIDDHIVDAEYGELPANVAYRLNQVRERGNAIFAVGTTSVRVLESAPIVRGKIRPFAGMVDLYIKPGHQFRVADHMVTNFHLPRSSLLVLVSAFAGRERILAAYQEAIRERYRFYSYGDAMLIL